LLTFTFALTGPHPPPARALHYLPSAHQVSTAQQPSRHRVVAIIVVLPSNVSTSDDEDGAMPECAPKDQNRLSVSEWVPNPPLLVFNSQCYRRGGTRNPALQCISFTSLLQPLKCSSSFTFCAVHLLSKLRILNYSLCLQCCYFIIAVPICKLVLRPVVSHCSKTELRQPVLGLFPWY